MKKFLLIAGFLFYLSGYSAFSQELVKNHFVSGVCYAGNKVNLIYIPPPKEFLNRSRSKHGGNINVIYSGFSPEARNAMEYATGILESVLPEDLNLTIKASWTTISSSGVLGNSSITGYAAGWAIDAFQPFAYYPVAVAEKIAGKNLNDPDEADVELVLNKTINWYFGTDGKATSMKYDLVTVILHELCHGLGFFDSMTSEDGTTGSYGIWNVPVIYDLFVEDLEGNRLTDTLKFAQNSTDLFDKFTGGQLYFGGPLAKKYMAGARPRLYAPSQWDPGSSISHLDETRTLPVNALMTPFIDRGEAIHDPGKLTLSILGDVGWINTRIMPDAKKDSEAHLSEIDLGVEIKSDTLYDKNNVGLVYSFDDFKTSDTLKMINSPSANHFTARIPVPSYNTRLSYYFYAIDNFLRIFRSPSVSREKPYSIYIGTDTIKPSITHSKPYYYFEKIDTIDFMASVTDNLGIDTVYVEYKVNNGAPGYFGLKDLGNDSYDHKFFIRKGLITGGDSLKYRIVAVDKSARHNTRILPSTGYYSIKIETLGSVVKSYSTDFSVAASDFFNSGFEITKPSGFNSPGLHSEHPYKSPDKDYASLEFSSVLRHPVIFDESGMEISMRELVLVEPGEEGSVFGFSDFYDYVILEGSKDYGKSWIPLSDGYDSRFLSSWETAYNSSMEGQNSIFTGNESMMVTHSFFPKPGDKISGGDSVLIRFRLYSDPYAHGWGWAIDDLKIGPLVDQVEETVDEKFSLFPNPGRGLINLKIPNENPNNSCRVSIYTVSGQCIFKDLLLHDDETTLNISDCNPGLYLIIIRSGSVTRVLKYSLIK